MWCHSWCFSLKEESNWLTDIKEHVAITIFASTAADSALAISIFAADDLFYNIQVPIILALFAAYRSHPLTSHLA